MFSLSFTTAFALLASLGSIVASPTPRQNGFQVINNCQVSGDVALTFDDGPFAYEGDVASVLGNQKGTFFLNGNNYECIYNQIDQVRALHAAQHTLGSHTWSHADLTKLDEAGINEELRKVEEAFIRILGLKPLYFRPPYGSYNDLVLKVLAQRGYKKLFLWTEDTGDANGESAGYSQGVLDGVIGDYPNPHLVLSHSTIQSTATQVLPYAVPRLEGAGYRLVSVDTCLGGNGEWPYEYIGEPGTPDGSWTCY
ncbi:hypothetical protein CI109_103286 [Kwoniella shandongensis]|uniref:Uncharacterized protein n=1 Tax=Kwoniella shandongensis TaxID=1734106 RepID=A0A5M6BTR0_9TREE|nr:uncharacterized protein CI109_006042 [Kwoniella shandongensis]KAA5525591.1 hypothetical protein CI109_006042 [Kwoniella shandongensis]